MSLRTARRAAGEDGRLAWGDESLVPQWIEEGTAPGRGRADAAVQPTRTPCTTEAVSARLVFVSSGLLRLAVISGLALAGVVKWGAEVRLAGRLAEPRGRCRAPGLPARRPRTRNGPVVLHDAATVGPIESEHRESNQL